MIGVDPRSRDRQNLRTWISLYVLEPGEPIGMYH